MRNLMIIISIITGITVKAQSSDLFECGFKGNIKRIIEKSEKFPDSWREYNFDSLYRLQEKKYFRENKLVQTEHFINTANDSLLVVTKSVNGEFSIDKYYFNPSKRLKRHEMFSSNDTICPMSILTDFIYIGNELKQYKNISTRNSDTIKIEYLKNNLTARVTAIHKGRSSFIKIFEYDKDGNLISETVDFNDPDMVLGGVITWSKFKRDKYKIEYELDKYGNWITRYSVTELNRYKIEEREIEYK